MKRMTGYQNIRGNQKYKDSLFRMVFQKKEDLLDLYNAVNGTSYENTEDMEITTLENVLYIKVKNDVSFIIGCTMNLYEHQSSYNPNMPLRGLMYFCKLYNIYIEQSELNWFSSTLQKIPTPNYVVFYNGLRGEPDRQILRLSDAFETEGGCLECEAVMLNINYGHNLELMKKCRRLEEYAIFVETVRRKKAEGAALEDAIAEAIEECIEKEILPDILREQRAEVVMFVLETFNEELYERDLKREAYEEGRKEGKKEGFDKGAYEKIKELVQRKLAKGNSVNEIAEALEESAETIQKIIEGLQN